MLVYCGPKKHSAFFFSFFFNWEISCVKKMVLPGFLMVEKLSLAPLQKWENKGGKCKEQRKAQRRNIEWSCNRTTPHIVSSLLKTANAARSCPFWEFSLESKYLITFTSLTFSFKKNPDLLVESKFWERERDPRYSERIKMGGPPSLHDTTFHWLHGNSIPKIGCHYFWPRLVALPKNTLFILLHI